MLEGNHTAETKFSPTDHRSHRPRSWLLNGLKKVEQLRFLENAERTLGQAAFNGCSRMIASLQRRQHLRRRTARRISKAPDTAPLTSDEMAKIEELDSENFGIEEEPPKFKGTMGQPQETQRHSYL